MNYYRSEAAVFSYSRLSSLNKEQYTRLINNVQNVNTHRVKILCYCLMPNHFHLLVKQEKDEGSIRFISAIENSFAKYFNIKHKRIGPLFLPSCKNKIIRSESQFIHVSRYIHLNPYTAGIVKTVNELHRYPYSSYLEYYFHKPHMCDLSDVLYAFNNNSESYTFFVENRAEYQRKLKKSNP